MLETSIKPFFLLSLTDTLGNISQFHNNMHFQINMNSTKNADITSKTSKNAFKMCCETTRLSSQLVSYLTSRNMLTLAFPVIY